MSVSLYRKYRPQCFADVIGQKSAVDVLTNSILRDRVGHAYLFSGSRGCGKTSAARIFAKALNCTSRNGFEPCGKCLNCTEITAGESLDVIEIDGASNNGVDNIRGLKENASLSPFNSRRKIYIIDEVHMLSQGAFNALLKTLEEPPEHVIFIMATTEPHKVPVTIRSRCQHIPFRAITPDDIYARLVYVCNNEGINFEAEALREISRQADGALRDALSLLEQVSASGDVAMSSVEAVLGAGSRPAFERWIRGLREKPDEAYAGLRAIFDAGASGVRVFEELFTLLRDMLVFAQWKNADGLNLSEPEVKFLADETSHWRPEKIHRLMRLTLRILSQARLGVRNDILLGIFLLDLVPEPELPRRDEAPSTVSRPPVPQPPVSPPVTVTSELREELLSLAHEGNFCVCCAMFDMNPSLRGNDLILDIGHKYTFMVMKVERNSAEISDIFKAYNSVILRYNGEEYVCPRKNQPVVQPVIPETVPAVPETVTSIPESEPDVPARPSSPARPTSSAYGSFGDILRGLASMGLKPEVILYRQTEAEDDEDDIDIPKGEDDD